MQVHTEPKLHNTYKSRYFKAVSEYGFELTPSLRNALGEGVYEAYTLERSKNIKNSYEAFNISCPLNMLSSRV